jgi:3-hydroxyacyl-CoA dehydrogenase/enoyl-CoA hydratase/3-hydroxybutyryl-CoA epimerase
LEVLSELDEIVTSFEDATPAGVVIMSGKPTGFAAGADVREFDQQTDAEVAREGILEVHKLFGRIEALPCPTVAAIHGFCLGGGLELALACDYRVALDDDKTRIGFPEIQLGIFPGFGGAARSIRHLGGRKAMEVMLSARMYRARQARSLGLVDKLVGRHGSLRWAAYGAVMKKRRSHRAGRLEQFTSAGPVRKQLANIMEKQVAKKARRDHYPAPYALIDLWRSAGNDFEALLEGERNGVSELLMGDSSRNLRRVFRLREQLNELGKADDDTRDWKVRRVHVVGAGVMGGDIAAWCALRGYEVTLQDREIKYVEPALKRANKLFKKRLKKPNLVATAKDRLIADVEGHGIARADVIIEAIFENLEAKQELFERIEKSARPEALLASNTSAIPLEEISSGMKQPKRLIGLHFFNPVAMMPLVEVVRGANSAEKEVRKGCVFSGKIGKLALPVKSAPGFLVNRVLGPYMLEAFNLRSEGFSLETIDAAAEKFGMPMGPGELMDTVGLDVGLSVASELSPDSTENIAELKGMVDAGKLGKKSGEGIYKWEKGKAVKGSPDSNVALDELGKRLIQPLVDECQRCLDDGIVENADLVDGGVIFGTGFAPFRGGPLHYQAQADK